MSSNKKMKGAADGVFRLGISQGANDGNFSGHVDGIQIPKAWLDESATLHVDTGTHVVSSTPRTNDYGSYYIVNLQNNGFFVTAKETVKEKRPYLCFKKMAPRQETAAYGS